MISNGLPKIDASTKITLFADLCRLFAVTFVHMITMDSMKVPIMDIVDVVTMLDSFTAASLAVLMIVVTLNFAAIAD